MNGLFVDTSGWFSFLVVREGSHQAIRELLLAKNHQLITSNYVFAEIFTLLVARGYEGIAVDFGDSLRAGDFCAVYRVSDTDEEEAWKILKKRRGRGLSFTDATIVAMMARLHLSTLITLDKGFREFDLDVIP